MAWCSGQVLQRLNNAVRNGELVGSSIDGVSNPAEHVRRVAQKWGEIRRSERGTQPQGVPQQPAPRGGHYPARATANHS